jgi:hypothetical protein
MAPMISAFCCRTFLRKKLNVFLDIFLFRSRRRRRSLLCVLKLRGLPGEGNGTKGQEYEKRANYGHPYLQRSVLLKDLTAPYSLFSAVKYFPIPTTELMSRVLARNDNWN